MTRDIEPPSRVPGRTRKTRGRSTRKRNSKKKTSRLSEWFRIYVPVGVLTALGIALLYLGIAGYSFGSQQVFSKWRDQRDRGDYLIGQHDRVAGLGTYPFAADELVWFSLGGFVLLAMVWWWSAIISATKRSPETLPQFRRRFHRMAIISLSAGFAVNAVGLALEVLWVATGARYSNYLNYADATSYILPIVYFAVLTVVLGAMLVRRKLHGF